MRILAYTLLLCLNISCSAQVDSSATTQEQAPPIDTPTLEVSEFYTTPKPKVLIKDLQALSTVSTQSYSSIKKQIASTKKALSSQKLPLDTISKAFKAALVHQIIPFWEGTPWSFEGHTAQPKSGEIACGYFVSTTLRDVGLNLNRYRLAQQSPINEAKSLAVNSTVKEFSFDSNLDNIQAIREHLKEGIHFIGFDESHVGYILKEQGQLYLIHSNYVDAAGVLIETVEESEVFKWYNKFHIVELSTNEAFLNYWLSGQEIVVVKE